MDYVLIMMVIYGVLGLLSAWIVMNAEYWQTNIMFDWFKAHPLYSFFIIFVMLSMGGSFTLVAHLQGETFKNAMLLSLFGEAMGFWIGLMGLYSRGSLYFNNWLEN